ncbi:ferrous iron transport protein A [Erysipelotrichaceae bacterium OH741_COT-311]|nr:ferrous iron transport protein A [Erysipelotrichaceae bacterium OH741_COT-311]
MTLKEIGVNHTCIVSKVVGDKAIKKRLMDMGIIKGVSIKVVKIAPLGDPIQIELKGYELTIRKEEADKIIVG